MRNLNQKKFLGELSNSATGLRKRKIRALAILVIGISLYPNLSVDGQQKPLTNREFVLNAMDSLAQKTIETLNLEPKTRILIQNEGNQNPLTIQLSNHYIKHLLEADIQVYTDDDSVYEHILLSWLPFLTELNYQKCYIRNGSKNKRIQRTVKIALSLREENRKTGKVVWTGDLYHTGVDTVLTSDLDYIEKEEIPIKKPDRPNFPGIRAWLDPVLAISTISIVAYLFYSIRSK